MSLVRGEWESSKTGKTYVRAQTNIRKFLAKTTEKICRTLLVRRESFAAIWAIPDLGLLQMFVLVVGKPL